MDIFEETFKLAEKIQNTNEYTRLEAAKQKNDSDNELQDLINEFNMLKLKLQHNNSHEDESSVEDSEKLNNIYDKIMSNENMIAFNKASEDMNFLMNKINKILVAAVNGQNFKDTDFLDSLENDGCSGNCSGCGGCH